MKVSPIAMAMMYFFLGVIIVIIAIQKVNQTGWDFFAYLIIAFAAFDFLISYRFWRINRVIKQIKKKQNKED
ncbi:YdiK family protein [Bacillus sp. FJAT-45037]|uniref:YdiK family protein n=1 Tax=Bacillus sp. FJAT-45037 TaxID=2011007 RepID=UPI000C24ED51|nr:YdiK family protein [Bacillus sp. FJAT-45037]